jgi:hypothetical protein
MMSTSPPCRQNPAQAEMDDAMTTAFSNALQKLGVTDLTDPAALFVGRKIVRAAMAGERDPTTLCNSALEDEAAATKSTSSAG